jgi:hypothetical protein
VNPAPSSLSAEENFNVTYWAIQVVLILYTAKAWQGDRLNRCCRNSTRSK